MHKILWYVAILVGLVWSFFNVVIIHTQGTLEFIAVYAFYASLGLTIFAHLLDNCERWYKRSKGRSRKPRRRNVGIYRGCTCRQCGSRYVEDLGNGHICRTCGVIN